MQTTTWQPPAPHQPRPSWGQVIGWYFAGAAATIATWSFVAAVAVDVSFALGRVVGLLSLIAGIVVLSRQGSRMQRRCLLALVFGVVTPFLLAVAFVIAMAWAFAHSNWTF